ncbi:TetR/AcrR family transcriptional regulator [Microbacterium sp. F2]|uniref:TetR/AcrR family transcriptional regulator n=1 Tax=Microbacterium sp. F2 TaxID=3422228 RepID=UPI003FD0BA9F
MPTKPELLDSAIAVLRRGENLTIDAVAREAGLTKPGVVHHFSTKEALTVAVVDRLIDRWESDLRTRASDEASSVNKLRAYVDYALTGTFDQSDLALLADVNLRDRLCALWAERLDPWFGSTIEADAASRASLRAARLLADGAWFNAALGIPTVLDDERTALHSIALQLINQGDPQ